MKKYIPCHDPAISARFWPKSCHFCPFLSLFRHYFGCHGHKYAYFRHRSHMHLLWTYTKLVWSSFGHRHASVMNTGASKMGDFWVKIRSQWQGRSETGIHRGNSLSPQITSILIGKHFFCLGRAARVNLFKNLTMVSTPSRHSFKILIKVDYVTRRNICCF